MLADGQSKRGSIVESLTNVVIGYGLALTSQIVLFHIYGVHFSLRTNMAMGLWFTVISIIRSYTLRRVFNRFHRRGILEGSDGK